MVFDEKIFSWPNVYLNLVMNTKRVLCLKRLKTSKIDNDKYNMNIYLYNWFINYIILNVFSFNQKFQVNTFCLVW